MPGGAAVEHAAEGIIAKAAKSVLRDAVSAGGKDAARDAARDTAKDAARDVTTDVSAGASRAVDGGVADVEHAAVDHVDLDALPSWHNGGQPDPLGAQNVPDDYKPYGDLDRQSFYDRHYNDAEGHWDYPPDDGFTGDVNPNDLKVDDVIDRYGQPTGAYTSPADTPFDQRALPPTNLTQPYYKYRVEKPLPSSVTQGTIAPAFEQPGGGVQHFFDKPISWYTDHGFLKQIYP